MTGTIRKIVRVFLASPGDLEDERSLAKATVDEFNETVGKSLGYHVDLVGWEDTIGGYGRPQSLINKDLEQCEYFIGLMWQRWGSRPDPSDGEFSSGFEEEFELSLRRRKSGTKPEISLFFKSVSPEFLNDPGEGLRKVLAFRTRMETEKRIMFETFKDEREYLRKLRRCIFQYIRQLADEDEQQNLEQQQDRPTSNLDAPVKAEQLTEGGFFSNSELLFGRAFLERTAKTESDETQITALEVARFRLLADIVQRPGNDEGILGVHDANLIYIGYPQHDFGMRELTGLADCGFRNFSSHTTPLWRWIKEIHTTPFFSLSTRFGSDNVRQGALLAMSLIKEPLWIENDHDRNGYLEAWFAVDTHTSIKISALKYLSVAGLPSDLEVIRQELKRNDFQTRSEAARAILKILLGTDHTKAIAALIELQPDNLDNELIAQVFKQNIDENSLLELAQHRNSKVRKPAIAALHREALFTIDLATRLLSDTDADIRYESFVFLTHHGRSFTLSEAKTALVKPKTGGLYAGTDSDGNRAFDKVTLDRLGALSSAESNELVLTSTAYDYISYLARVQFHFQEFGSLLRSDIADQFEGHLKSRITFGETVYGPSHSSDIRQISDYLRARLTRRGLDLLCEKMLPEDLALIRATLARGSVVYSARDVAYLSKFGNFDDISLLISMTDRPDYGEASLLSFNGQQMYSDVAKAMHRIGRDRLIEMINLTGNVSLKRELIIKTTKARFGKLPFNIVLNLLRHENAQLRTTTCLKCLSAYSQRRLKELADQYAGTDIKYFYDVVHWFDFGISIPSPRVRAAANDELARSAD